ncbi:MAG: helix-turn-helix domain-containing protein [Clostridia bacterium]|nr:helix-turn-helix domain-containing protein [Clostridia bacterium]
MEIGNIPEEQTIPTLMMSRYYNSRGQERVPYRYAEFFEISVYLESSGTLYINDHPYTLHRGDVRFIRPGTKLRSIGEYSCYSFWFRFGKENNEYSAALIDKILPFFSCGEEIIADASNTVSLFAADRVGSKLKMNMMFLRLLYKCYSFSVKSQIQSPAVQTCIAYLREHFSEQITLEHLGTLTGYVPLHVLRIFKAETGETPHDYLCNLRMTYARNLLLNTDGTISEVASKCGFQSSSHFQTLFKQKFGITPGKYRKSAEGYDL